MVRNLEKNLQCRPRRPPEFWFCSKARGDQRPQSPIEPRKSRQSRSTRLDRRSLRRRMRSRTCAGESPRRGQKDFHSKHQQDAQRGARGNLRRIRKTVIKDLEEVSKVDGNSSATKPNLREEAEDEGRHLEGGSQTRPRSRQTTKDGYEPDGTRSSSGPVEARATRKRRLQEGRGRRARVRRPMVGPGFSPGQSGYGL